MDCFKNVIGHEIKMKQGQIIHLIIITSLAYDLYIGIQIIVLNKVLLFSSYTKIENNIAVHFV